MTGYIELKDGDLRAMIADYFSSRQISVNPDSICFGTVYQPSYMRPDNGEQVVARISIDTEKKPVQSDEVVS